MRLNLAQQIEQVSRGLASAKPRSHLRLKLELKLRDLILRKLKQEIRAA